MNSADFPGLRSQPFCARNILASPQVPPRSHVCPFESTDDIPLFPFLVILTSLVWSPFLRFLDVLLLPLKVT